MRMRWVRHVTRTPEMTSAHKILVSKPERKNHSEDSHRWENNIKMYLKEIECEDVDWT
jgi:hypothetical protein